MTDVYPLVILGIGKCMMDSGAADRIVRAFLRLLGEKRVSIALMSSSYLRYNNIPKQGNGWRNGRMDAGRWIIHNGGLSSGRRPARAENDEAGRS